MTEPGFRCTQCPRLCTGASACGKTRQAEDSPTAEVSFVMHHAWEEPCVSGPASGAGCGAVFFTHCPLGCVYCQNRAISRRDSRGTPMDAAALAALFLRLQENGAVTLNLISPTQYTDVLCVALHRAKTRGLTLPVVWNTGGFERPQTIRRLRGLVDVYLTDFKYADAALAARLSHAPSYPETAAAALVEMFDAAGAYRLDENGILRTGVLVRHLLLPGQRRDSIAVLRRVASLVPPQQILLSLLCQYTPDFLPPPSPAEDAFRDLRRRVTTFEYDSVCREALSLGFDGFTQERVSATRAYTPDFTAPWDV